MKPFLRIWYPVTIVMTALSLGPALAHLLEMTPKLAMDGALWLQLLHTLYPPLFGTVGAFSEVGAVLAAVLLVVLVRHRGVAFTWALAGAALLLVSHGIFWVWISPVNAIMGPLTADMLPANWMDLRNQWEYGHATRAGLQLLGLIAFVVSLIGEVPRRESEA